MIPVYLTHPDFSKLAGTELLIHFKGRSWDFPGIFLPGLFRFGAQACIGQGLTEAIALLCNEQKIYLMT